MLSDEDLKCLERNAEVGGVMGPWRDMLDLIDEVRRLRELVEAATEFHIGELVVRAEDGTWQAYTPWLEDGVDEVFRTRDEAIAYARERSGR